jgi:hypothetical protein
MTWQADDLPEFDSLTADGYEFEVEASESESI